MSMQEIKFDSKQKKSGFNKYGHYQFGNETCIYCKSDRTEWVANNDGRWLQCQESACGGKSFFPEKE